MRPSCLGLLFLGSRTPAGGPCLTLARPEDLVRRLHLLTCKIRIPKSGFPQFVSVRPASTWPLNEMAPLRPSNHRLCQLRNPLSVQHRPGEGHGI
jgi:hypothetical protein